MSISFHIHTCRVITIKILRYLIISAHVAPLFFHIWMDWNIHTKNFFNCLPHSFITKKTKVRTFLQDRHHSRLICSFHQYPVRTQPPPYRARLRNPAPARTDARYSLSIATSKRQYHLFSTSQWLLIALENFSDVKSDELI